MDRMGKEAREAPRAEPSPSRRHGHHVHLDQRTAAHGAPWGSIRHHPGCRHPASQRSRLPIDRGDCAPVQPDTIRPTRGTGRRGLRDLAAPDHALLADRPPKHDLPADRFRPGRRGPLRGSGVRCLSGPLRGRVLHGQGDLRRRHLRGGAGGEGPGEHTPQPRSFRGRVRARRAVDRRGSLRGVPHQLRSGGPPPPSVGAGRLAAPAVDPGLRA